MKLIKSIIIGSLIFLGSCSTKNENNINEKASVSKLDDLPENPLLLSPITFSINPNHASMSTLYGNQTAFHFAKNNEKKTYPKGAVLYEVSWKQKADSLWFGANIPSQITSVERLLFTGDSIPKYELYTGHPLKKIFCIPKMKRIHFIISQRMAFTP